MRLFLPHSAPRWAVLCVIFVAFMTTWQTSVPLRVLAASVPRNEHSQSNELEPQFQHTDEEDTVHPFPVDANPAGPLEERDEGPPLGEGQDDMAQALSFGELRNFMGYLETCRSDLFSLGVNNSSDVRSNEQGVVSKGRLRSCREMLFRLIRLFKRRKQKKPSPKHNRATRAEFPLSGGTPNLDRQNVDGLSAYPVKREESAEKLEIIRKCKNSVCAVDGLPELCSGPTIRLKPKTFNLCTMCFPRNEQLIELHCAGRARPEGSVFLFFCGLFLTLSAAAGALICLRRLRKIRQRRLGMTGKAHTGQLTNPFEQGAKEAKRQRLELGAWDPRRNEKVARIIDRFRRDDGPAVDLEDYPLGTSVGHAGDGGLDVWNQPRTQDRKVRDEGLQTGVQRVPVMPRARSSSVQLPSTRFASSPSLSAGGMKRDGVQQRFATVHTTSPATRRLGSRRFESSP